jgi:Ca2+-binding RTX toxin-like protein
MGGAGNDRLVYTTGMDTLDGGVGSDTADFTAFASAIQVYMPSADYEVWTMDRLVLAGGAWRVLADLQGIESVIGGGGDDQLIGDAADNRFAGGAGNDSLMGGAGNDMLVYSGGFDTLDGGTGTDTADFTGFASAIQVNLPGGGYEVWTMDRPMLAGGNWRVLADLQAVENVTGGDGNDQLIGDAGFNEFAGGLGDDVLTGGANADRFTYKTTAEGRDSITDFTSGPNGDVLDIRSVLVGYTPGSSNAASFVRLLESDGSTSLNVNADGIGSDFTALALLEGVTGLLLSDMMSQGNLAL